MSSDHLSSNCHAGELGGDGGRKVSVSDDVNGLHQSSIKSDSFVVDMERISHLVERDINANTRITRNLSRKGSGRNGERKIIGNEKDTSLVASSPRAMKSAATATSFHGGCAPEKPAVVATGGPDNSSNHQIHHHQITITNGGVSCGTAVPESKFLGKKFSFRRSATPWTLDPRRILFFFATLSCMGTILLIYFTLSMGKLNGEENALN